MSQELKPCPGCGGKADTESSDATGFTWPVCTQCGFSAHSVESWNRRTPGPATKALIAWGHMHLSEIIMGPIRKEWGMEIIPSNET